MCSIYAIVYSRRLFQETKMKSNFLCNLVNCEKSVAFFLMLQKT